VTTMHETSNNSPTLASGLPTKYLTFFLGEEEFGVDILSVQEIRGLSATTRLPGAPETVRGVINLRGVIVPVVDLRIRLGLSPSVSTATSVVIVLGIEGRMVGLHVDAVSDVLDVEASEIQPPPELGGGSPDVLGMARRTESLVVLLDAARVARVATSVAA